MKVKIYTGKPEDKEQEVFLKLTQGGLCDIFLTAVNSNGNPLPCGNLLRIHPNLEISRCCCVNKRIGIPLTLNRQVKIKGIAD